MKRFLLPVSGLAAAGTASLLATSLAHGAIVSARFNVTSAQLTTWRSGTFDGSCAPNPPDSFFLCERPTEGAVAITPAAGGGGSITLKYDDATGEVTEITSLDFYVSDMTITVTSLVSGTTTATVTAGNSSPVTDDFPTLKAGTAGPSGSADADQNPAVGIFQHDAPGPENDATDFAAFANIVDTCIGAFCPVFPVLSIDALRYEIQGVVSGGAYQGTLWAEGKSSYLVSFTSVVPVPPTIWLLGTAVAVLGGRRCMRGKAVT